MNYIKLIDDYIESKKLENNESILFTYNIFDLSVRKKNKLAYKDVDINKLIRNILLSVAIDCDFEILKEIYSKLLEINFDYMYEEYIKNPIPKISECIEFVYDKKEDAIIAMLCGPRAFRNLGIEKFYDSKKTMEYHGKIIESHMLSLRRNWVKKLFPSDFLSGIFPEDVEITEDIKICIVNCIIEKYELQTFESDFEKLKKEMGEDVSDVRKNKIIYDNILPKKFNMDDIVCGMESVIKKILQDYKSKEKKKFFLINKLQEQREILLNAKLDIKLLSKIDFKLLQQIDENMYKYIFEDIFESQRILYNRERIKLEKLKKLDNKDYLNRLFSKFKINYKTLDSRIIELLAEDIDIDSLETKFKIIKLDNNDNLTYGFIKVLINTSVKDLNEYMYYVDNKILTKAFLFNSIYIFSDKEFKEKCSIILSNKLSYRNLIYDESILLHDISYLKDNLKLLELYGKLGLGNNFNYFYDSYNFDALDLFIENDIDINSLNNIRLNNVALDDFIKRLKICLDIEMPIYKENGKLNLEFLLGSNFYCKPDELENYIYKSKYENNYVSEYIKNSRRNKIDFKILLLEQVKKLEAYKSSDNLTYEIDGIVISRNKVLRNLTIFNNEENINDDTVLQSIIYNSSLSDQEIELIKKCIFENKKIKRKR